MNDEYYMAEALRLAREAADDGETPVGAVVVRNDGFIAGRGRNRREKDRNALAHAEIAAIDEACRTLGGWRLSGCTIYVTLEPCMMCTGAIINSRIDRVVFAAYDKAGSGALTETAGDRIKAEAGVLRTESEELLGAFFSKLRRERKMSRINYTEVKTDAQTEAVAAIADEIWHEWFPPIIGEAQTDYMVEKFQSVHAIKEQLASEGYTYYIMFKGSTKIGYTAIRPDGEDLLFLSKIYIKKEYRGNGYARETFEFLKDYCRRNGFKAMWLTVNKHNDHAAAVYEKCGFYKSGEGAADIGNGFVMDDYYFRMDID